MYNTIDTMFKLDKKTLEFTKNCFRISGVYLITINNINYIGSSSKIGNRIRRHIYQLNKKCHTNKILQLEFNRINSNIEYKILEECSDDKLLEREQYYKSVIQNCSHDKRNPIILDNYLIQKFYDRVIIGDNCWNWNDKCNTDGYPIISHYGKDILVHRLSYTHYYKRDISNSVIRHLCHNKLCTNPQHLSLGSLSDNSLDNIYINKYKISMIMATLIRNLSINKTITELQQFLLEYYSLKLKTGYIRAIIANQMFYDHNWCIEKYKKELCHLSKICKKDVDYIRSLYLGSFLDVYNIVKDLYEIKYDAVVSIIKGKNWKDKNYKFEKSSIKYNKKYSKDDIIYIQNNYTKMLYKDIASYLGRSTKSIKTQVKKIKENLCR